MIERTVNDVSVSITDHSKQVAADQSAAKMITEGILSDSVAEAIHLALEKENRRHEFAVTTAIDAETGERHTTTPTKGVKQASAPTFIPNSIITSQQGIDGLPEDEPSREMTGRDQYKGLVAVHTHPVVDRECGSVGLSAQDIRDDIFAGDDISTKPQPFDVYRAKAAIVFANDETLLPVDTTQTELHVDTTQTELDTTETLLDERPRARPWLHLVERTEEATTMTASRANDLHYKTLDPLPATDGPVDPKEEFEKAKQIVGHTISELLIPLSP